MQTGEVRNEIKMRVSITEMHCKDNMLSAKNYVQHNLSELKSAIKSHTSILQVQEMVI